MKIIYAGVKAENYNPVRYPSFEYSNFYLQLKAMSGIEIIEYPGDRIVTLGKKRFNEELLKLIDREKPDLFFAFMYSDELDIKALDEIKKKTKSVAWFSDDHWRLHNYSRFYAPHFTLAVTTWSKAPEIYAQYGIKNIFRSQWAYNASKWKPAERETIIKDIDVSFVGQRTEKRASVIKKLKREGINVYVRGFGWSEGRVSEEEKVKIILRSKISLNINEPPSLAYWKVLARLFFKRSAGKIVPDFLRFKDNLKSVLNMRIPQIKARPFEVLGCHAFLISGYADDMNRYYEDGKEIVYYDGTISDLVGKIRYYLAHDEEREKIADAGYERTLRENTYEKRFNDIFKEIGLSR